MPSPLGRPVRVGVFEHDPDAFKCFRRAPTNCDKPGAEMEIVRMVMDILGWEWEVVDTKADYNVYNDFGNLKEDGQFSGIMGLLENDTVDMSGLSMRITPERMQAAHFTFPIRYFQQVYIVSRPPESDFRNFIFATFTTRIWILLFVTIIGVAFLRFIIAAFVLKRGHGTKFQRFGTSLLEIYGVVVRQRLPHPQILSAMILEGTMIVLMLVVYTYYQSAMNSKLTAPPKPAIPFLHQSELIDLLESGHRYLTYYYNFSLEGSSRSNQRRLKKVMLYNPIIAHEKEEDVVAEIRRGGVFYSMYDIEFLPHEVSSWDRRQVCVFLTSNHVPNFAVRRKPTGSVMLHEVVFQSGNSEFYGKDLTVIRDTTGLLSYVAFGFSKGNRKLCRAFNTALMQVLPGVPQITLAPGNGHKKDPEDISVQARKSSLSLTKHLEQLFEIYIIGMGCCMLVFLVEVIVERLWRAKAIRRYSINNSEQLRRPSVAQILSTARIRIQSIVR